MLKIPDLPLDLLEILESLVDIPNQLRLFALKGLKESKNQNVHGETSMQLDLIANDLVKNSLMNIDSIKQIASEEEDNIIECNKDGKYLLCFDPLDGSSLINTNQAFGMVFAVYDANNVFETELKNTIKMSFYFHIGQNNSMVLAFNSKVYEFEYLNGEFKQKDLKLISNLAKNIAPGNLSLLKVNNVYSDYVFTRLSEGLKLRYFACLISDIHFILSKASGIFIYLNDQKHPNGKLRLMYEVAPVSHILTTLGAVSVNHSSINILDIVPSSIHQNSSLIIGSSLEVDLFKELVLNVNK